MHLINLPLDDEIIEQYGGILGLEKILLNTDCNSIEWIWGGRDVKSKLPKNLTQGYHLTFYSDWLDFFNNDKKKLIKKFGNMEVVKSMYGSDNPDILLQNFISDLKRAISLNAKYVVFHISDVSIEEGYTYKFEHTDDDVIDACTYLINEMLKSVDTDIYFLVENLWWAGFRFTDIKKTEKLLSQINYKNKGIMLDTGHLLNTNPDLVDEESGIDYIKQMLELHKDFLPYIKGLHLNKSLSGKYIKDALKKQLKPIGKDYFEQFMNSYSHILKIDQHKPFTSERINEVIEIINPEFVVHELSGNIDEKIKAVKAQRSLICTATK